jgi:GMP synthase-like glutamine amidotransferase
MRVLVLRHHEEDSPGLIQDALEERGATVDTYLYPDPRSESNTGTDRADRAFAVAGAPAADRAPAGLPDLDGYDRLVILGSSSSVYASEDWIAAEIDWLRHVQLPVLGICFGAQLLSSTFGGSVERSPVYEIGWVTVTPVVPGSASGAAGSNGGDEHDPHRDPIVGRGPWFQFHGDRCVLPPAARVLAHNDVCVQAFTIGPHLGVQFHPEVDAGQLERWIDHGGREDIVKVGKDPETLLEETAREEKAARARAGELVDAYLAFSEHVSA